MAELHDVRLIVGFINVHDRDNYCLFYLDIKSELRPSESRIILLADSREIWTTTMLLDAEMAKSLSSLDGRT